MNGLTVTFFRFCEMWGLGFTFLIMVSVVALLSFIVGSALAWVFFLSFSLDSDVSFGWSIIFSAPIAPYFFGRALPHFKGILGKK